MPTVPRMLPAVALSLLAGSAWGGSPENTLLIVNPSSAESLRVANHYAAARGIPASNVLYVDPAAANYAALASGNVEALFGELNQRGMLATVDQVVVMPGAPFFIPASGLITDGCSPVNRFAITTGYTLAFVKHKVLGGLPSTNSNRYAGSGTTPTAFRSTISWLGGVPSGDPNAERYFLCTMLGYSGGNGNTVEEILDMIDRSVAADGTFPAGTFYFMDNQGDPARNVRAPQFPNTLTQLAAVGGTGQIIAGVLPGGKHDALGIMTGAAAPNIDGANLTILPGAFADHLTSFAATFDTGSQTKMSRWIAKGASGTSGTVEEPCNYLGKFPSPRLHVFYRQGLSLGEAWFRSQGFAPYQSLFTGDPLTRPWAHIPVVGVADFPAGAVSGVVQFTPTATTTNPDATIQLFDLYIDGVFHSFTLPGFKFSVDTSTLHEGAHDVRVVARDGSAVKTPGRWIGTLEVDHTPHAATLAVKNPNVTLAEAVVVEATGTGAPVAEVRILQNGRVVAAGSGEAEVSIFGRHLGAGPSSLQAEVLFADGTIARSLPAAVEVANTGNATPDAPKAFGYTRVVDPAGTFVLALPSSHGADLASATTTVLSGPFKSTSLVSTGHPYRVFKPIDGASGTDLVTFRVTTPQGSSEAVVTIVYDRACPGDCEGDGDHDIFDFLCFQGKFAVQDPYADFEGDGDWDVFDFLAFQNAAAAACP